MGELDRTILEEMFGDPVTEIVLRRLLIGFKGTVEQLARNVKLDYGKYGGRVQSSLDKLVRANLANRQRYARQAAVYSSIPDSSKRSVFEDERVQNLKDTGFITLRARLK